jgi:SAM-dependent methyltransferase
MPVADVILMSPMFTSGEGYERFMGRWSRKLAPLLVEFGGIEDGWKVLDVGSGTGALSLEMVRRLPRCRVTGIDASKEFVEFATARGEVERARFEAGDAQQLRFADGQFDACVSLLVFNFLPEPVRAAGELRRVTKTGGPICAAVWDYPSGMEMLKVFWESVRALDAGAQGVDESRTRLCGPGELEALWREAGIGKVETRRLEIKTEFASFEDYWEPFLAGIGPTGAYAAKLDTDGKERLREHLRQKLQGRLTLDARAWAVRGVKE